MEKKKRLTWFNTLLLTSTIRERLQKEMGRSTFAFGPTMQPTITNDGIKYQCLSMNKDGVFCMSKDKSLYEEELSTTTIHYDDLTRAQLIKLCKLIKEFN